MLGGKIIKKYKMQDKCKITKYVEITEINSSSLPLSILTKKQIKTIIDSIAEAPSDEFIIVMDSYSAL